jgi:hypothetical protein
MTSHSRFPLFICKDKHFYHKIGQQQAECQGEAPIEIPITKAGKDKNTKKIKDKF